ncbi:MAG: membrane-associated protease 1 [Roseburia sp.]|nr:membrane-associated protease 1 [Roseburia sp.]
MGFTLKVEGNSTIELDTTSVTGVKVKTDIPLDSNARSTDLGSTVTITGKILTAVDGDPFDSTRQLGLWALVPAENADCYRKVTIEVIAASQVVRKYSYPNAFVVDYKEDYGDLEGVGIFTLVLKQKKDKMSQISVEGGYSTT